MNDYFINLLIYFLNCAGVAIMYIKKMDFSGIGRKWANVF